MNYDETKQLIEEKFKAVSEATAALDKALSEMRSIELDFDTKDQEELKRAMALGKDIDSRANYAIRSLLVKHGNILFI